MKILVAVFVLASVARAASIRDVDFKNFSYPLPRDLDSAPGDPRWMHLKNPSRLVLHDGQHKFCGDQGCPSAWLETGSRAYMGLRQITFDHEDLILIANDPENRQGECCSTGSIAYSYRWMTTRFRQFGAAVRKDGPPQ
jgi:hypothetical protein